MAAILSRPQCVKFESKTTNQGVSLLWSIITWQCTKHCNYKGKANSLLWTHSIYCPHGWAMGYLLWVFGRKLPMLQDLTELRLVFMAYNQKGFIISDIETVLWDTSHIYLSSQIYHISIGVLRYITHLFELWRYITYLFPFASVSSLGFYHIRLCLL